MFSVPEEFDSGFNRMGSTITYQHFIKRASFDNRVVTYSNPHSVSPNLYPNQRVNILSYPQSIMKRLDLQEKNRL